MESLAPSAGFIQFPVAVGDPGANLARVGKLLERFMPPAGAIMVLPELWASGFDYHHAADLAGRTPALLDEIVGLAGKHGVLLGGSCLEQGGSRDGGSHLYNTFFLVGAQGVVGSCRKQHLFSLWQEDRFFTAGGKSGPLDTVHGPVGALICYDLRFPELAREQAFAGAKLLLVTAQWPKVRLDHWRTLVRARAVENQVYVVAGNGCGVSGEHELAGHSMVVGPDGSIVAEAGISEEVMAVALNPEEIVRARSRFCSAAERPYRSVNTEKIVTLPRLQDQLRPIREQGGRVAFTNGCFDILHSGHADYLEQARKTADCLVVGLNSDASVRRLKGGSRPVNSEADRARLLASLDCIDFLVVFEQDTPLELIKAIMPDVLVKGADWPEDRIVGAREVIDAGGRVVRIPFAHDLSTSGIISSIMKMPPQPG